MREVSSGHSATGSIVDKLEELIKKTGLGITDYDSFRRSRYGDQSTESHDEDAFEFLSGNFSTAGVPTIIHSTSWLGFMPFSWMCSHMAGRFLVRVIDSSVIFMISTSSWSRVQRS